MIKQLLVFFALAVAVDAAEWYDEVLGIPADTAMEFQQIASGDGATKFIVVEFYTKHCPYCQKFYPVWNRVVQYYTAAYRGDMIFVKVDGDVNSFTSHRYGVAGYPSYVVIDPGSDGATFNRWESQHKDRKVMMEWIEGVVGNRLTIDRGDQIASTQAVASKPIPDDNSNLNNMRKALNDEIINPINETLFPTTQDAIFLDKQVKNNAGIGKELDFVISQAQQNTEIENLVSDTLDEVILTQENLQQNGSQHPQASQFNSLVCFLSGIIVGALGGMVFVLYLVSKGKLGQRKQKHLETPGKEHLEFDDLKKSSGNIYLRNQHGLSPNRDNEDDKFV